MKKGSKIFKIVSTLYVSFAKERVQSRFLISNAARELRIERIWSNDWMKMANYRESTRKETFVA
jgi:hypothetical protein